LDEFLDELLASTLTSAVWKDRNGAMVLVVSAAAVQFGVSERTVFKWLDRFRSEEYTSFRYSDRLAQVGIAASVGGHLPEVWRYPL